MMWTDSDIEGHRSVLVAALNMAISERQPRGIRHLAERLAVLEESPKEFFAMLQREAEYEVSFIPKDVLEQLDNGA